MVDYVKKTLRNRQQIITSPVDTGLKLNIRKTFRGRLGTSSQRLIYVQFTSSVYGIQRRTLFNENHGNTKKINIQFHYRKFSKQRNSILFCYYKCITRGRRGRGLSCKFLKIGRKCSYFAKKRPDFGYLWVIFLI